MSIPQFSVKSPSNEIAEALDDAGCVVITGVTNANLRQSVKEELAPHMEKARVIEIEKEDPTQFYPGRTRRVAGLVARSPTITDQLVATLSRNNVAKPFSCLMENSATSCILPQHWKSGLVQEVRYCTGRKIHSHFSQNHVPISSSRVCGQYQISVRTMVQRCWYQAVTNGLKIGLLKTRKLFRQKCRLDRYFSGWVAHCMVPVPIQRKTGATASS